MAPLAARPRRAHRRRARIVGGIGASPATADAPMTVAIGDQPRARTTSWTAIPRPSSSARTSRAKAASTASPADCSTGPVRRGCSTRCSTSNRSSGWRWAPGCPGCFRSPRSSTSPICTTPRTRSAAKARRCSSSRIGSTATRWSCGSRATAIRRASADTSTTTTRSPRSGTSPEWSSHRPRVPTTPRRCCTPAPPRRRRRVRCASSSNPSRCITRATCTRTATSSGSRPIRRAGVPIGRARTYGDGTDLTILTFANGLRMSLRVARRLESRGIAARVVDLRWLAPLPVEDMLREADASGKTLIVDETRQTGGVGEGILADPARTRLHRRRRPGRQRGQLHPARRRRAGGAAVGGDDRGRGRQTGRLGRSSGDSRST